MESISSRFLNNVCMYACMMCVCLVCDDDVDDDDDTNKRNLSTFKLCMANHVFLFFVFV